MFNQLNGKTCDHVGSMMDNGFRCSDCHKQLTKEEFQLKVSRQIIECEEIIKREQSTNEEVLR